MKQFNNSFATIKLREEQSPFDEQNVTGGGEAYNASLHASKKKRNPFTEDELSGYKKLKGFRAGHTRDTGGFQYSDLWGVNEGFEVGDSAKVTKQGDINYNKIGKIIAKEKANYYTLQFENNTRSDYHESNITIPAKVKDFQDKPSLEITEVAMEKELDYIIKKDGKSVVGTFDSYRRDGALLFRINGKLVAIDEKDAEIKPINAEFQLEEQNRERYMYINENHSNSNVEELERVENLLSVAHQKNDYSVMTAYENRIKLLEFIVLLEKKLGKQLPTFSFGEEFWEYVKDNFGYSGKIKTDKYGAVSNLKDIANYALNNTSLKENYHRFKKETVTRSKEQQMHEAMKLVRKKLYEAEKVIDYVKTMKEELGLQEYKSHTNKLMEKLQVSISEIYKKYKSIK